MESFLAGCKGCGISQGIDTDVNQRGGIIELDGNWILNHYGGQEGFLGWVILQPRFHRMELTDLAAQEATTLGMNIQNVDRALRQYWALKFETDLIQRVYVTYFHESVFGKSESGQQSQEYHLHIHLIPRTARVGQLLRKHSSNGSIRAWSIPEIVPKNEIPAEYQKSEQNMPVLITYLRSYLATRCSKG